MVKYPSEHQEQKAFRWYNTNSKTNKMAGLTATLNAVAFPLYQIKE